MRCACYDVCVVFSRIKSFSLKNSPQENAIIEGILAQQTKYGILANIQVESQDKFYYTTIGSLTFQCEATRQNLEVTSSQSDQWGQDQWQQADKWNSWNQGNDHDWKEDSWTPTRRAKYPKARSRSRPRWAH